MKAVFYVLAGLLVAAFAVTGEASAQSAHIVLGTQKTMMKALKETGLKVCQKAGTNAHCLITVSVDQTIRHGAKSRSSWSNGKLPNSAGSMKVTVLLETMTFRANGSYGRKLSGSVSVTALTPITTKGVRVPQTKGYGAEPMDALSDALQQAAARVCGENVQTYTETRSHRMGAKVSNTTSHVTISSAACSFSGYRVTHTRFSRKLNQAEATIAALP